MTQASSNHSQLSSVDYARLIQYTAQKFHKVLLNKTQINKILFYVYGVYLAETGETLFNDDTPKAWPYGPVFPIANKKINPQEVISSFSEEKITAFKKNTRALQIVAKAVHKMYNMSALSLTRWSHQEGSPWYKTIYLFDREGNIIDTKQNPWNSEIKNSLISSYFSNPQNKFE